MLSEEFWFAWWGWNMSVVWSANLTRQTRLGRIQVSEVTGHERRESSNRPQGNSSHRAPLSWSTLCGVLTARQLTAIWVLMYNVYLSIRFMRHFNSTWWRINKFVEPVSKLILGQSWQKCAVATTTQHPGGRMAQILTGSFPPYKRISFFKIKTNLIRAHFRSGNATILCPNLQANVWGNWVLR